MNEIDWIAEQVSSGYREGAWPGVAVRQLFRDLSATDAADHPIATAHSAWEIALHLGFWHDAVRRRLAGEVVDYALDEDWPRPAPASEGNWRETLHRLDQAHEALVKAVRVLTPDKLRELVPGKKFTAYFMLHGVPQHDLYHGGQVVILTKALRLRKEPSS